MSRFVPRATLALPIAALAGLLAAGCAPQLTVPPHLVAAWPTAGAELPVAPHTFALTFNRGLRADATWAAVWRDEDGSPVPSESTIEPANPKGLRVRLLEPLPGQYRLHWHVVAVHSGAVADGEQTFSMHHETSPSVPRLEVTRLTAESGDKVEIVGKGFADKCLVRLTIGDDEQALTSAETDSRGAFVVETRVPPGVAFGVQPVSAVDIGGNSATAALQVRWGGWPPLVAFTIGQPGPASGEVTFSVSVRNRSDYVLERVRVVLSDPQEASYVAAEPSPQRLDRGVAWEIPTVDRGVVGPFRATYRVTGGVVTHARIEFRHRRPRGCNGDDCLPAFISETTSDSTLVYPAD